MKYQCCFLSRRFPPPCAQLPIWLSDSYSSGPTQCIALLQTQPAKTLFPLPILCFWSLWIPHSLLINSGVLSQGFKVCQHLGPPQPLILTVCLGLSLNMATPLSSYLSTHPFPTYPPTQITHLLLHLPTHLPCLPSHMHPPMYSIHIYYVSITLQSLLKYRLEQEKLVPNFMQFIIYQGKLDHRTTICGRR